MTRVTDLSAGSVLVSEVTGIRYRVQGTDGERVVLVGPEGSTAVDHDDLQRDIASGKIGVRS